MSLPPLIATLGALTFSIISDAIAMTKPLVSLEGFYDLHLFPERDRFDYTVSETHKASQATHVIAICAMGLGFLVALGNVIRPGDSGNATGKRFTVLSTTLVGLGLASYIVAISTLIKIGIDYKHIADDIPIINPKAEMELGAIMDIMGLLSAMVAFGLVISAVVRSNRQGFLRLL